MKRITYYSFCILMLFVFTSLFSCAQNIATITTATNNVIVVSLTTDWINIKETNRVTQYVDLKPSLIGWEINGESPSDLGINAMVIDEKKALSIDNQQYFPIRIMHKVYLMMDDALVSGKQYSIHSPYGDTTFTFQDQQIYCESIKINQVGYNLNSTARYANFGIYMGDKGSQLLDVIPQYAVKDSLTDITVLSGELAYWGDDTGNEAVKSGEYVYRMDLSSLQSGTYYIVIEGIGRSFYFGVGEKYSRKIAGTHVRGLYHQRCGIALEQPYTNYNRGICHQQVAFTMYPGNGNEGQGWINVPTGAEMHDIAGGYHDAGDFDRRVYHTIIPLLMLNYYEAFQDHFIDNQYNIPESGNGIPDFLDETMWGVLIWENLQLDEANCNDISLYGGVMGGTETNGHPGYGIDRADWENEGNQVYGTYDIYESTTFAAAGFFAQASRLLAPYDLERSTKLLNRAHMAWDYAETNGFNERIGFKMYAALQLYIVTATGVPATDMNNSYHLIFRELAQEYILNGGEWPYQYISGNSSARITTSHFISYLTADIITDESLAEALKATIKYGADIGGYMRWLPEYYPYAQGVTKFFGWGAGSAQGRYADPAAFMYRLSENPEKKQYYYDLVSQYGDYSLGLNPLSKSYVTGLGDNQVASPLHLDSYFTKYGETPNGGTQTPIGNVPGIVVFGFSEGRSGAAYQTAVSDFIYPQWDSLPGQRRWNDGWSLINNNEFSTHETMVWNTCMYSVLYSAQADSSQQISTFDNNKVNLLLYPNPTDNELTVSGVFQAGIWPYIVTNIWGEMVMKANFVATNNGVTKFHISHIQDLPSGIYVIQVRTNTANYSGKFIKR